MRLDGFFDEIGIELFDRLANADCTGYIKRTVQVETYFQLIATGLAYPFETARSFSGVGGAQIASGVAVEIAEKTGCFAGLPAGIDTLFRPVLGGIFPIGTSS